MKKILFLASVFCFLTVCSCSCNDDEQTQCNDNAATISDEVCFAVFWDETEIHDCYSWEKSPLSGITRSSYDTYSCYGYTGIVSTSSNFTVALNSTMAQWFNVSPGYYIANRIVYKYDITISGLADNTKKFILENSPYCGLYPASTNINYYDRGYTASTLGDTATMTTMLLHLISSVSGISYDRWYPCSPDSIEWTYSILTK